MNAEQNEFQAEMNSELDAENRAQVEDMTPADHWNAINELMETIVIQAKDLEENARKLKEDCFNIFPKF